MSAVAEGWRTRVFAATNCKNGLLFVDLESVSTKFLIAIFVDKFRFVGVASTVTPWLFLGIATGTPIVFFAFFHNSLHIVGSIDWYVRNVLRQMTLLAIVLILMDYEQAQVRLELRRSQISVFGLHTQFLGMCALNGTLTLLHR